MTVRVNSGKVVHASQSPQRKRRQIEAEQRQYERQQRSDEEQLQKLIDNGHGECKEAKKLKERITKK